MSLTYRLRDVKGTLTQRTCTLAARVLVQGEIDLKGVMAPGALDPKPFTTMAKQKGLIVEELIERTW